MLKTSSRGTVLAGPSWAGCRCPMGTVWAGLVLTGVGSDRQAIESNPYKRDSTKFYYRRFDRWRYIGGLPEFDGRLGDKIPGR